MSLVELKLVEEDEVIRFGPLGRRQLHLRPANRRQDDDDEHGGAALDRVRTRSGLSNWR